MIELVYPVEIGVDVPLVCESVLNLGPIRCEVNTNTRRILIKDGFGVDLDKITEIQFWVKLRNPINVITSSFTVTTHVDETNGWKIDTITEGLVPALKCNSPCKDCIEGMPDNCTDCY